MRGPLLFSVVFPLVGSTPNPVLIVPGDGSNQLEAKTDKPSTVSWRCSKKSDWFSLWLNTYDLLAKTACWSDNIILLYDEDTDEFSNNVGVQTRVPDWGTTTSFEKLDPSIPGKSTCVFCDMVDQFVKDGLVRNETLRGAPYDFRFAASSQQGSSYIASLKSLIEETANATGQRVSLVSHSMGCLQVLYLLNQQTQQWKDQYVEKWIPLAGPWGGSASEMGLFASGSNESVPTINALDIRGEQRSYESNFWLAPVPEVFGNMTLIETTSRNYSAQDYNVFFDDIGYPVGKKLIQKVLPLTSGVVAPGVDVVCMYSSNVPTPLTYKYGSDDFDVINQTTTFGDGDGTVNEFSLELCGKWTETGAQSRSASVMKFSGLTHSGMLNAPSVISALETELGLTAESGLIVSALYV